MKLGAFSISLTVKNLFKSMKFYENLGFSRFGGSLSENYVMLKNGETVIGLFQDMFDKNILTFNPGWDQNTEPVRDFTDIREILNQCRSSGIEVKEVSMASGSGPGSFVITDPDGNDILFDQHR